MEIAQGFLFYVYRELDGTGFRLASISLKRIFWSSSAKYEDWPSYHAPADLVDRGAFSYTHLYLEPSERDPNFELVRHRIGVGVTSWSRLPTVRVSVELMIEKEPRGRELDWNTFFFYVEFKPGDNGRGVFTVLHEHYYEGDLSFYKDPSLAMRSLINPAKIGLNLPPDIFIRSMREKITDTIAVAFDKNGNHYIRKNALEFLRADADEAISLIAIDSLGRMVVYELYSEYRTKHIGVIRFD